MYICGIEDLSLEEVESRLQAGARFVYFEYCVSLLVVTVWRPSSIYFVEPGQFASRRGWPYTLLTVLFGWWGIPWGPICTIRVLGVNLNNGRDVTPDVRAFLAEVLQPTQAEPPRS